MISKRLCPTSLVAGALVAAMLGGCAPKLDPKEYGRVIPVIPHIKGSEKAFPLPELDQPEEKASTDEK